VSNAEDSHSQNPTNLYKIRAVECHKQTKLSGLFYTWKTGPAGCAKTSVASKQRRVHIPEERRYLKVSRSATSETSTVACTNTPSSTEQNRSLIRSCVPSFPVLKQMYPHRHTIYSVIKKDGLESVRLYFLNYT
jgi:hypothetical protein